MELEPPHGEALEPQALARDTCGRELLLETQADIDGACVLPVELILPAAGQGPAAWRSFSRTDPPRFTSFSKRRAK